MNFCNAIHKLYNELSENPYNEELKANYKQFGKLLDNVVKKTKIDYKEKNSNDPGLERKQILIFSNWKLMVLLSNIKQKFLTKCMSIFAKLEKHWAIQRLHQLTEIYNYLQVKKEKKKKA